MFKFNFDIADDEVEVPNVFTPAEDVLQASSTTSSPQSPSEQARVTTQGKRKIEPCHHISLEELMRKLPESISYSPLHLPFAPEEPILRRDLFDARFQLASGAESEPGPSRPLATTAIGGSQEETSTGGKEDYIDAKTDLIPGLYEGGLKTWEGGVDLVEVLYSVPGEVGSWARGGRILEVGCGTAIPTCFLLRSLLSSRPPADSDTKQPRTILHLQDFNLPVLSLVTLPNLILATLPFIPPGLVLSEDGTTPSLKAGAGDVVLTAELLAAVRMAWDEAAIDFKWTYGHWSGFADDLATRDGGVGDGGYDLVLTAETIYSPDSLDDLISVLREGQRRGTSSGTTTSTKRSTDLESSLEDLTLTRDWRSAALREAPEGAVLVGAKVLYFGVGGDLHTFIQTVRAGGGDVEEVQEWMSGVGRKVVRVDWDPR